MNIDFDWLGAAAEMIDSTPVLKDGVHDFEFKGIECKETKDGTKIVELSFREKSTGIYVKDSLWFNATGVKKADFRRRRYSLTLAGKENISIKELEHEGLGKTLLLKTTRDLARERYYLDFPTSADIQGTPQNQPLKTSNPGSTDDLPF